MSATPDRSLRVSTTGVPASLEPVPRTVVGTYDDPVKQARAELKAALAAIEEKANVPKRVAGATDRAIRKARRFTHENPGIATAAVVGIAAVVGVAVWGAVLWYTRPRR